MPAGSLFFASRVARVSRAILSILGLTLVAAWLAFEADAWPSDAPWTRCLVTGLIFHATIAAIAGVVDRFERRGDSSSRASWTLVCAIGLAILLGGLGVWGALYAGLPGSS